MKYVCGVSLSLFVLLCTLKQVKSKSYDGHQLWRVVPKTVETLTALYELGDAFGLDFWKDPVMLGNPVDFRVPPYQAIGLRRQLQSKGIYDIQVSIEDIQALINSEKMAREQYVKKESKGRAAKTVESFDYSVYHTADEVYDWMDMVVDEHGDFVTKKQVGVTYQGRPIYVLEFKKPSTNGLVKPVIYIDALIHCREWITAASVLFVIKEMLQNDDFAYMLDDVDWYFVPMINVDGYIETWTGDRLWRKTLSTGASSLCSGVDANRNWDIFWSGPGASPNPCSLIFYGPMAASESEVRHLQNYIMDKKDEISAVIATHSYSQLILYPYAYTDVLSKDDQILNETGKAMSDAVYSKHNKRYVWGPTATTTCKRVFDVGLRKCSGITTDWTYEKAGITQSYTYELRDKGHYAFILPADQIIPNGEEYLLGIQALADYVIKVSPTETVPAATTPEGSGG